MDGGHNMTHTAITTYDSLEAQLDAYQTQLEAESSPLMKEYYQSLIESIQHQLETH